MGLVKAISGVRSLKRGLGTANAKVKARSRRGEFNILWLIVAVIAVVIAVVILYLVYAGSMRVIGAANVPAIGASSAGGVLTVNIGDTGVGNLAIYGITLYSGDKSEGPITGCSTINYYINGQQQSSFSFPYTLKPGQTLTITASGCPVPADEITAVQVITSSGAYTAPVT